MKHSVLFSALLAIACAADPGASPMPTGPTDAGSEPDAEPSIDANESPDAGAISPDAEPAPDATVASCPEGEVLGDFFGKPVFTVYLDGAGPFDFVYDTGAPTSAADLALDSVIGNGTVAIRVGGQTIDGPLPIADIRSALNGDIDGILGSDLMGQFSVTLDPGRQRFWLETTRDEAALRGCNHVVGAPVELTYHLDDYFYVPGHVESLAGWFLLDSGASLGAMPEVIVDRLLAAEPRPYLENFYTPAAIGTFWARLLTVGSLEVGGLAVDRILTRSVDNRLLPALRSPDGNPFLGVLPSLYLRHFMMTLDQPAGVLRLDAYAGDPLEETETRYVAGINLTRNTTFPPIVESLLPGSGAESAGILPGDAILMVNGIDLSRYGAYTWPWALTSTTDGEMILLRIDRAGAASNIMVRLGDLLTSPNDPH